MTTTSCSYLFLQLSVAIIERLALAQTQNTSPKETPWAKAFLTPTNFYDTSGKIFRKNLQEILRIKASGKIWNFFHWSIEDYYNWKHSTHKQMNTIHKCCSKNTRLVIVSSSWCWCGLSLANYSQEILRGLGVAQATVTERWPWKKEKTAENQIFFRKKIKVTLKKYFLDISSSYAKIWGLENKISFLSISEVSKKQEV